MNLEVAREIELEKSVPAHSLHCHMRAIFNTVLVGNQIPPNLNKYISRLVLRSPQNKLVLAVWKHMQILNMSVLSSIIRQEYNVIIVIQLIVLK